MAKTVVSKTANGGSNPSTSAKELEKSSSFYVTMQQTKGPSPLSYVQHREDELQL